LHFSSSIILFNSRTCAAAITVVPMEHVSHIFTIFACLTQPSSRTFWLMAYSVNCKKFHTSPCLPQRLIAL
jgi:hypothetical protein